MFGVFAIDEILRYRGTRFPGSRTLCHPALEKDDVYEHADDDDDVDGSDDNHDEDEWSWCWWTQSAGLIPIALTNNMAKLNEQGGNTHFLKHKNDAFFTQSFRKPEQWWLLQLHKKLFFFL